MGNYTGFQGLKPASPGSPLANHPILYREPDTGAAGVWVNRLTTICINEQLIIELRDLFIKDKKDLGKIVLCDLQNEIYPNLERAFLNLLHDSGYESVKFSKKVDFEELYKQRFS